VTKNLACGTTAIASGNALRASLAGMSMTDPEPQTTTVIVLAPCTYELTSQFSVPPAVTLIGDPNDVEIKVSPTVPESVAGADEVAASGLRLHDFDTLSGVNVIGITERTVVGTDADLDVLDQVVMVGLNEASPPYDVLAAVGGSQLLVESSQVDGPLSDVSQNSTIRDTVVGLAGRPMTLGDGATLDEVTAQQSGAPVSGPASVVDDVSGIVVIEHSALSATLDTGRAQADAVVSAGGSTRIAIIDATLSYSGNDGNTAAVIVTAGILSLLRSDTQSNGAASIRGTGSNLSLTVEQSLLDGGKPIWAGTTPSCQASFAGNTLMTSTCG
jgi:hypothetical protein